MHRRKVKIKFDREPEECSNVSHGGGARRRSLVDPSQSRGVIRAEAETAVLPEVAPAMAGTNDRQKFQEINVEANRAGYIDLGFEAVHGRQEVSTKGFAGVEPRTGQPEGAKSRAEAEEGGVGLEANGL